MHKNPWRLYDLSTDRIEANDLDATHPEKVQKMKALYDARATRCGVIPWEEILAKKKK